MVTPVALPRNLVGKRTETARRESEQKFRNIIKHSVDGIFLVNEKGVIVEWNPGMAQITGLPRREALGQPFWDIRSRLVPEERRNPKTRTKIKTRTLELIRTGKANWARRYLIREIQRPDGTRRAIQSLTFPIKTSEGAMVSGILRDVTELKRAERLLQEKNEALDVQNEELQAQSEELMAQQQELMEKTRALETASQFKSQFLAGMSHELRTPLNAVIGFSQLMLDGALGEINDTQRQCLTDILDSGQHLLALINDVLDLSRVEAGKLEMNQERLNLSESLYEVLPMVKSLLDASHLKLKIEVEPGLPAVDADKNRLRQIMLNLLSNAIKFTLPGGKIAVKAVRKDSWCQVSVIDSGIGIPKEDQERIFEAFTQIDPPAGKRKEGTGLGLTITRQFVEMGGGKLWLESEYGKGSNFTFTLPFAGN